MESRASPKHVTPHPLLTSQAGRQRLLRMALWVTQGTALAPTTRERQLLDRFVEGELTIDQVLAQLDV